MSIQDKFQKWSNKIEKGSEKYEALGYVSQSDTLFHMKYNARKKLEQLYIGVLDKGRFVSSFYYNADMKADTYKLRNMAVIIKEEKEIICHIDEEYYSNRNENKPMEIIILYLSEFHTELIFAAPHSIPYVVSDYGSLNGNPEFRFRYTKLLIESVLLYLEKYATERLPEISVSVDTLLNEEETDEE